MEIIKQKRPSSFLQACKMTKTNPNKLPIVSGLPKKHQKYIIAAYKLAILQQATVGKWKADYSDENQYKYFPIFYIQNKDNVSSFAFSDSYYGSWRTGTGGGSRLVFPDRETSDWFGKKYKSLYKDFLMFTKY